MTCPYAVNRKTVTQITYEYNENGFVSFQQEVSDNTAEFLKCTETSCGAWQDGKCAYKGE